jgi:N-acetylmuramoyl-L-alanine amidase
MAVIVLDPGHGGTTKIGGSSPNNATGPNGLKEKEVTLKVAFAAEKALAASGHQVVLTRRGDNNLGIVDRAEVARQRRANVFVSIHFNAPGGSVPAQGTETWIGEDHTEASKALATAVQRRVRDATGHRNRGVKVGNVSGVIKGSNHDRRTANCLVEISFLSLQPAEEERLRTQAYIDKLGQAIADAILEHLAAHELMPAGEEMADEMDIEAAAGSVPAQAANGRHAELGASGEEEGFGVPFNMLDAFERLSEMAPHGSDTAVERDENLRTLSAPAIGFGPNARAEDVTAFSRGIVIDVMRKAGLAHLVISSTSRSPADQARVMFNNLERFGVDHQKALYGPAGDQVIEVYRRAKRDGQSATEIKRLMTNEIVRVGPTRVSRHASDPNVLNVFDVAPSSVSRRAAFEQAVRADRRVAKFIVPPSDPGYHLEIPQRGG